MKGLLGYTHEDQMVLTFPPRAVLDSPPRDTGHFVSYVRYAAAAAYV